MNLRRVVIESPYAALTPEGIEVNVAYARAAMADAFARGDAPFASHLLYTQPGILNDSIPEERRLGIDAGLQWAEAGAQATVVYVDLGITDGMRQGIARAEAVFRPVEYRSLPKRSL